ncbi:MAG: RDD family protein [Acidimicrobiia bacterium]
MEPIPEQPSNETGYDLASVGSRLGARAIDVLIGFAAYAAVILFAVAFYDIELDVADAETIEVSGGAAFLISWGAVVLWAIYEVLLTRSQGQTVGKMVAKIRVVSAARDGQVPWGTAAVRWGVLAVPMTLIPGPIGLLVFVVVGSWFIWDKKVQGLHDKAAGTYVVRATPPPPA